MIAKGKKMNIFLLSLFDANESCFILHLISHNSQFDKLTHLSLASLLWDIGKQNSPRCDAAERGVPSGAILFAQRNFIEKSDKK